MTAVASTCSPVHHQISMSLLNPTMIKLLRGPSLWLAGFGVFASAIFALSDGFVVWPPSNYLLAWSILLSLWTISSCAILFNDICVYLIDRFGKPSLLFIYQWSLDDVLRLFLDPQQLWTNIVGFVTITASLYTLPTTPEERARVFQGMGVLPSHLDRKTATEVLETPGGWTKLLPLVCQSSACNESDDDDDNDNNDGDNDSSTTPELNDLSPYSISPIYREMKEEKSTKSEPIQVQPSPRTLLEPEQLHQIIGSIVLENIQKRWSIPPSLVETPTHTMAAAAVSALLLALQLRFSSTARSYCRTLLHLLLTTATGTALGASILGTVSSGPYAQVVRHLVKRHKVVWKGGLLSLVLGLLLLRRHQPNRRRIG